MKRLTAALVAALLLNSVCALAQQTTQRNPREFSASLDAFARKTMEKLGDVPAVGIVVIKDDKPIFVRAYGLADIEGGIQANNDTLFYIASSTKAFTALAASMLDKEGKIKFSDPATKYAAGIQFKNAIPEKITIRDLLVHTSGLRNDWLVHRTAYTGQIDPREISHVFANGTTVNDAILGTYRYTNLGYNVYGLLLENTLKKKWQDLLQERVFDPAGMKHTTSYISKARAKKWTVAAPYYIDPTSGKTVRSVLEKKDNNMQAAGGIFSSISDLGRWLNLNMNDGKLDGKQVIPAELVRAAHTGYTATKRDDPPFIGDGEYGLGWQIGKYRNEKVIYHHGGFTGYSAHLSYLPDRKIAVAVVTNHDAVGARTGHLLATYAYDWWLGVESLESEYDKQLSGLFDAYTRRKQGVVAGTLERSKRTWQLSKPFADYGGRYSNDLFGTIDIVPKGNSFEVRMGNLSTVATPFTEKDTIRVEMIPGGNGEVIGFKETDGKYTTLTYGGMTFTRVP
ncbi:MAG TPA: serine hydrolase domain-containing protein [Pyrinomonadaceae bacterium]|nr:serine hydrolase domain-containing protein [Pyrinomonadaceae bacterium]